MRNYKRLILLAILAGALSCTPEEILRKDVATDQNDQTADPDLDPND